MNVGEGMESVAVVIVAVVIIGAIGTGVLTGLTVGTGEESIHADRGSAKARKRLVGFLTRKQTISSIWRYQNYASNVNRT